MWQKVTRDIAALVHHNEASLVKESKRDLLYCIKTLFSIRCSRLSQAGKIQSWSKALGTLDKMTSGDAIFRGGKSLFNFPNSEQSVPSGRSASFFFFFFFFFYGKGGGGEELEISLNRESSIEVGEHVNLFFFLLYFQGF